MEEQKHGEQELSRYEHIEGHIYDMSPSPNARHQIISGRLFRELSNYLKGKPCEVIAAPFDVFLKQDEHEWVIPDISVICDPDKIQEKGCVGAPDLIIEILSQSTAEKDRTVKLKLYRNTGVKEYWIVDPHFNTLEVYNFETGLFTPPENYGESGTLPVSILGDLMIELKDIF